jgi:CRISPR/Cas system Type II protein with McrA/HNH and RuvC-like nuclease domain
MTIIVDRRTAREYGLSHYFTGKPCPNGHVARRQLISGSCMECRGERQNARRKASPEAEREAQRRYRKKNADALRERHKEWQRDNPEKLSATRRVARSRRRSAEGTHTSAELLALFNHQRGKCGNCKRSLRHKYHADHIMPLALGGTNWIKNIQLLCPTCNQEKHALHPLEWARRQGRLV